MVTSGPGLLSKAMLESMVLLQLQSVPSHEDAQDLGRYILVPEDHTSTEAIPI